VSKSPAKRKRRARSANYASLSSTSGDFVSVAIAYAEDAIADAKRRRYGKWVRLAARRFIKDLKRAHLKKSPFFFSAGHANRACAFLEELPHVEGTWKSIRYFDSNGEALDTETIELHPAHVFFVVNLFGFRGHDLHRRFTSAILAVARKNAKSTLAAGIMLYCLCFENEQGAQVLSAATTGQQARIVFNVAKRMIEKQPDLCGEFDLESLANAIARYEIGGVFKPINSKASTQDGLNPSHVSLDEIHAHKTHDLLNVIRSAAGAREAPLYLYTTTEGFETPGPWPELRAFGQNVLSNVIEADHLLCLIYAIDDEDDDFDESKWIKANPLMDVNPLIMKEAKKLAIEAKNMPGTLAEFRIKRLNRRSSSATSWTNLTKWRRGSRAFDREHLKGSKCWASLDLSSTTDMTAWRLLWFAEETYYTWGRFWVPAEAVASRTERKSVNYAGWVEAGFVSQCDGATIDYAVIERDVLGDIERYDPTIIAYDPWNASQLINNLIEAGVPAATAEEPTGLMQFIQGPKSYSPAMKLCETAYLNGKLVHGGDPVLTWHMSNVVPRYDVNMNVAPNKKRSPDKIDGACALFMCFGATASPDEEDGSDYFANPVRA
jgi:phage terminase large subunit-like protein